MAKKTIMTCDLCQNRLKRPEIRHSGLYDDLVWPKYEVRLELPKSKAWQEVQQLGLCQNCCNKLIKYLNEVKTNDKNKKLRDGKKTKKAKLPGIKKDGQKKHRKSVRKA